MNWRIPIRAPALGALWLILTLLWRATAVSSQQLAPEEERAFLACRLTVAVTEVDVTEVSRSSVRSGTIDRWDGYRGFQRISEPEFFRVAGFEEEADEAERYEKLNSSLTAVGVILTLAGLGYIMTSFNDDIPDAAAAGSGGGGGIPVGFVAALFGGTALAVAQTSAGRSQAPYPLAVEAAEAYNAELRRQLEGWSAADSVRACP